MQLQKTNQRATCVDSRRGLIMVLLSMTRGIHIAVAEVGLNPIYTRLQNAIAHRCNYADRLPFGVDLAR